uniref:Wall-associated receptor kinase galacturonan-binding domain-containing protein n=1 Tax=Hordeum vulgare subsp. vulgare TaxID=112509 RepID=A0A8I6XJ18_HORVV
MPPSCWFLILVSAWWLRLMLMAAAEEEQVDGCFGSAKRCGNITISRPFWLANMEAERSCGNSDFEVTCFNGTTPALRSTVPSGPGFAIIDISYKERTMRVVDLGKLELLHAYNSCQVPFWNTSIKIGLPFRIDPGNQNIILYYCTEEAGAAAARRDRALVELRCSDERNTFVGVGGRYDGSEKYEGYSLKGCISAFLPVLGVYGKVNASDYVRLGVYDINDGFLLTWEWDSTPGNCNLLYFLALETYRLSLFPIYTPSLCKC